MRLLAVEILGWILVMLIYILFYYDSFIIFYNNNRILQWMRLLAVHILGWMGAAVPVFIFLVLGIWFIADPYA